MFKYQLSNVLPLEDLGSITDQIDKHEGYYMVKPKGKGFAVYTLGLDVVKEKGK